MTGVAYRLDFQGTLQLACRLFPGDALMSLAAFAPKIWPSRRRPEPRSLEDTQFDYLLDSSLLLR